MKRTMGHSGAGGPVLRRLLEAAGYRLEDRPGGLRAVRGRDHRAVLIVAGLPSPAEVDAEFPSDAVHRTIVYPEDPGTVARSIASERGIEILDPSTLGSALGELLLSGPDSSPESEEPLTAAPLHPPPLLFPEGERTVRPRLGQSDAEALAGVDGYRSTLRLIPFFVAAYRVRVATPHGGRGPPSDHLVAINALSGQAEFWEPGERELAAELDEPHQRLAPHLSPDHARASAEDAVRRRHTVSVDHTEQHGGAVVIERRRVPPATDDLALAPPVLVHVPFWYIEGPDGRVVLDAVSGSRVTPTDGEIDSIR
ncbi:MAG TPA: hypothetical protein VEY07_04875 [Thermoplasmata archaeon]|nr:hypothetical protein [Thermoplasmata archaeon]